MKRHILILVFAVVGLSTLHAQQEPLYTQTFSNQPLLNPAAAGSSADHRITFNYRWQWMAFPGAPQTYVFSYDGGKKRLGWGAYAFADVTGPTSRLGAQLAYSYHIPLGKTKVSIGLAGRYINFRVDTDAIEFVDQANEPLVGAKDSGHAIDANAGVKWYNDKFYIGVSATNVIESDVNFGDANDFATNMSRHYFAMAGYKFVFKNVSLEPHLMVRYVDPVPVQFEGGIRAHFENEQLTIGAAYRDPGFISIMARVVFEEKFPIQFSFDFSINEFQNYSVGASEFSVGAYLPRNEEKVTYIQGSQNPED